VEYPGNSLKVALGIFGVMIVEVQAVLILGTRGWLRSFPSWLGEEGLTAVLICLNTALLVAGFFVAVRDVNRGAPQWSTSLACVLLLLAACPQGFLLYQLLAEKHY
jgi:hypothetical protein